MLAATNRADALDVALMRPGRFDVQLHVPLPDTASRQAILEVHTRVMPLDPSVNLQVCCFWCAVQSNLIAVMHTIQRKDSCMASP